MQISKICLVRDDRCVQCPSSGYAFVQRSLGAKDEWNVKASVLWGALLKMWIPLYVVIPGLIAPLALYPGIADGDRAFPVMIKKLLPPGLTELVFAAFFAGLMSSVDSTVNAASTIFTKDIYEKSIKKDSSDKQLLIVGRIFTGVLLVFVIITAPISEKFPGICVYVQTLLSFYQEPTLGILILGMFWARMTQWGGLVGFLGGMIVSAILYAFKGSLFTIDDPFLYISWWSFLASLFLCTMVSLVTKPEPIEKFRGLVYGMVIKDDDLQELMENNIEE